MKIGAVLPQSEIGADRGALAAYATGVTELGFEHILAYDHVLGADPEVHEGWRGPYDVDTTFHEPFVLFGYLAAITTVELVTGIVILPQRQTALVAKQAAEVDLLTDGKFRLGVGIGWNAVEYEALGQRFDTRGRRIEEQVGLLRRFWTERSLSFEGDHDRVVGAGLAPLPVQRPIPIWFGGSSTPAYRRMGRVADGWFPQVPPGDRLDAALADIAVGAEEVGRDPATIGMEGRVSWTADGRAVKVSDHLERWLAAGASHASVNTMGAGLGGVDGHLRALAEVAATMRLRP